MVLDYIVGVSDIAKAVRENSNTVSNWIKRDDDFPEPFLRIASGPLYRGSDISKYLVKRGYNIPALSTLQGKTGKIVIIGRARIGKSYLISKFSNNSKKYATAFSGGAFDKTVCNVNNIFIDDDKFEEFAEFHSDFCEKNKSNNTDEVQSLKNDINKILGKKFYLDNDSFGNEIKEIENIVRRIKKEHGSVGNTYITVYLHPSDCLVNVMRKAKLRKMEIVDTPGIYKENMDIAISKADLYMIILGTNYDTERDTMKYVAEELKPYVASSKIVFLYKGEVSDIEDLPEEIELAKRSVRAYENQFKPLEDVIINTQLTILNIAENTLLIPTMSLNRINDLEKYFFKKLNPYLESAFIKHAEEKELENGFLETVRSENSEYRQYLCDLLLDIPKHNLLKSQFSQEEYTLDNFKKEDHNRVKSKDRYRIYDLLHSAYNREVRLLDEYFSQFTKENAREQFTKKNVPEQWKQKIIKYVYYILSKSIRTDRGIGIGAHGNEEFPPRTMLVEESICAGELYDALTCVNEKKYNGIYRNVLQDLGIHSSSWKYVGVDYQKEGTEVSVFEKEFNNGLTKLKIIKNYLENTTVYCLEDLILCRYVCGLRKIGIHSILKLANVSGDVYEELMKDTIF